MEHGAILHVVNIREIKLEKAKDCLLKNTFFHKLDADFGSLELSHTLLLQINKDVIHKANVRRCSDTALYWSELLDISNLCFDHDVDS